jgi:glycine cleavage system transcriptional repressor
MGPKPYSQPVRHFAVCCIGRDRPGIVAALTRALLEHDVNVEDSQMTILRGYFTMTLVVALPETVDPASIRAAVERTARELGLDAATVSELDESAARGPEEPSHVVTVYGVDHPGIVNAVAVALADCGVNIIDLNTRLVGDEAGDLYAMMLEVALPSGLSGEALDGLLEATRHDHGLEVQVRELESEAFEPETA